MIRCKPRRCLGGVRTRWVPRSIYVWALIGAIIVAKGHMEAYWLPTIAPGHMGDNLMKAAHTMAALAIANELWVVRVPVGKPALSVPICTVTLDTLGGNTTLTSHMVSFRTWADGP